MVQDVHNVMRCENCSAYGARMTVFGLILCEYCEEEYFGEKEENEKD